MANPADFGTLSEAWDAAYMADADVDAYVDYIGLDNDYDDDYGYDDYDYDPDDYAQDADDRADFEVWGRY